MNTRKHTRRLVALVAMLLLMMTVLSSCGGQAVATLTVNDKADVYVDRVAGEGELKNSELLKIAEMISAAYSAGYDAREALVALTRGYDMLAEDFDPKGDFSAVKEMDPTVRREAAVRIITKANQTLIDKKADGSLNDEQVAALSKLTANDVNVLVEMFRTDVETTENGLWDNILLGIGTVLKFLTNTLGFGNYVLGICIFALVIEILMLPFAIKQQKNSIKQATLRPKEMAIRNKYKGRTDQPTMQKMQAEIQELYQRENFSPYSGCLPLLIQLPIIMILYQIVVDPLHYVLGQSAGVSAALNTFATASPAAGGLGITLNSTNGTIEMLSKIGKGSLANLGDFGYFNFGEGVVESVQSSFGSLPNFNIGPINFGMTPLSSGFADWTAWILLLVPVLTFATYFIVSKLNRKIMYQPAVNEGVDARQMACSNSMMDITMPAMSAFFTLAVPSVIGVYWAIRSWFGFAKTLIMSKAMPLPTFTEEDYKAAAKEMAGKKTTVKKSANAGSVRSLHYIDDEDFEDTRERGLARRAAIEEREAREQEAKQKNGKGASMAAPIKKDKNQKASEKEEQVKHSLVNDTEPETTDPASDDDNNQGEV